MTILGECISEGRRTKVRVSGLAAEGCDLAVESEVALAEGEFALWIGAIGPLDVMATRQDASHLSARFREPLDERILEHFAAD